MKPVFSVLSIIGGFLTGLGVLGYLQQSGSVYPTRNLTIVAAVLGIVWGIVVPTVWRSIRQRS
jgi:hypothetical protein